MDKCVMNQLNVDEYIRREDAILARPEWRELIDDFSAGFNICIDEYTDKIDEILAADVAPIVDGKWIEKEESFKYNYGSGTKTLCICSICGYTQEPSLYSNYNYFNKTKYCPNCGAKMDGE